MAANGSEVCLSKELKHKGGVVHSKGIACVHVAEKECKILQEKACKDLWVTFFVARQEIDYNCDGG